MSDRIDIDKLQPDAYNAMFGLEKYLGGTELALSLRELIKVRASQINGCAYCIQMHTEQAREHGETEQRLYAVSAWKESPLFSDEERAALALTDAVTRIAEDGVSDEIYDAALEALGTTGLAQSIMQIVTINAWNRIAIATRMEHM